MKFRLNTSPLVDGLELAVINANVSQFYQKSTLLELTIEDDSLRINTEVKSIVSELKFSGQVSGEGTNHTFVDCLLFKNLVKTLSSDTLEIDIKDDGITIYSGKSHFNLAKVVNEDDMYLTRPTAVDDVEIGVKVDADDWSFVKDQQLYSIAMSLTHPVYTYIWVDDSGNTLVGDFDNSIFTRSSKINLGTTCLLSDTVISLLSTVPENCKIRPNDKNFEIYYQTDPYSYLCEFTPAYEDESGVGDYQASVVMSLLEKQQQAIIVDTTKILNSIRQAELFSSDQGTLTLTVTDTTFRLHNKNIDCSVDVVNPFGNFESNFKISLLKNAISHMDDDKVEIAPQFRDGNCTGINMWTENLVTVIGGTED